MIESNDPPPTQSPLGFLKLWHPRGPLVSLGLPITSPGDLLAAVTAWLDAGWLNAAPGLEEGEEKQTVAYVVHGTHEHDGEETPTILLYSADEAMKWSFLKLFLNRESDVASFEAASGMKIAAIPVYVGQDKPERGKNKAVDRFIHRVPKPFGVVYKNNPKWNQEAADAAKAQNVIYKTARRVFVRWADVTPPAPVDADKSAAAFERLYNLLIAANSLADLQAAAADIQQHKAALTPEHTANLREVYTDARKRLTPPQPTALEREAAEVF